MVLTESSLSLFPANVLKVTASPWRALSVSLGSSGYSAYYTNNNIYKQAILRL